MNRLEPTIPGAELMSMLVATQLKTWLPAWATSRVRRVVLKARSSKNYEVLYEAHSRKNPLESSIGDGDFALIGRLELGVLLAEGLEPTDTLVDFGCGTGRLALHAIPRLEGGRYIGVDISKGMLTHARAQVAEAIPSPPCTVEFIHQSRPEFDIPPKSADMVCAFSVFTHMEQEDNYRYMLGVRKIIKDDGLFLFSCLPMELESARGIFLAQARMDSVERWANVRNMTTSREMMEAIARMSGWEPTRWYDGDQPCIRDPLTSEMHSLGQSTCVLRPVRDFEASGR
jgi:SAM-dependent methyltransferase